MLTRARRTDGQASVEWLGLVALVATLLGLGAALAHAGYVGRQVTREMARALCRVGQGDCERDHEPCVTATEGGSSSGVLNAFIVRLGSGSAVLIEQRSDGRVAVTRTTTRTLGLEGGFGADGKVKVKGIDLSAGGEVQASVLARHDDGKTWLVPNWTAAQDLLDRLGLGGGGAPRAPDFEYGAKNLTAIPHARVGVDALMHFDAARADLTFSRTSGVRVDRANGHRTVYADVAAEGRVQALGGVLGLSASRTMGGEDYAVDFDADGRPVDLQIVATGAFGGSRDLPAVVQPVAGLLDAGASEHRTFEVTSHLDLTDPDNLAAARGLLRVLADPGWRVDVPSVAQALRRRIDERGTVEARVLDRRHSEDELSAHGALGGKIGATVRAERTTSRLLAATSRGLDGKWLPRTDCVGA
jgi:hypothetical protein